MVKIGQAEFFVSVQVSDTTGAETLPAADQQKKLYTTSKIFFRR
jgi:hypothetical protein